VVSLRYFTVYGPRQRPDMAFHRLIRAAITGDTFTVFGDGNQTRDFTYVDDTVQATLAAAANGVPGRVYNIGGGSRHSMNDAIQLVESLAPNRPEIRYAASQRGDARDTAAATELARRDLDFAAEVDLARGLARQVQWQVAHADLLTSLP